MLPRFSFLISVLFLLANPVWGQDLSNRIPTEAVGVVKINTPRFFELVEANDFNQSLLGEAFVRLLHDEGVGQTSLAECGIALDRAAYMYALHTDSVRFTVFLWPLSNPEKLAAALFYGKEIASLGEGRLQAVDIPDYAYGKTTVYTWDESVLTVISPEQTPGYFDDPEVASRYGIANRSYYDFYNDHNDSEYSGQNPYGDYDYWDEAYVDTIEVLPDSGMRRSDADISDWSWNADTADWSLETDTSDWNWSEDSEMGVVVEEEEWYNVYEDLSQEDQRIKDSVLVVWTTGYSHQLLADGLPRSTPTKTPYAQALDSDAIISVWVPDVNAVYGFVWPEIFSRMSRGGFMYTGAMQLNAYAEKDLRITATMDIADSWLQPIERMYDRKINRKFFRYINSNEMIGMYGFATNTQAIVEELPAMLSHSYKALAGPYEEELGLAAEMVSLLLDEEAVGRALRGDGLFVLNGLEERDVPFTHYDWDEDYNIIEVDSVKTELVPDFLLMLSSDDRALYDRFTAYGVTKGYLTDHGRFVEVRNDEIPFGIYLAHHRGILFVSSSLAKVEEIIQNRHKGKMARHHRRMLRQNTVVGVFSVANLGKEFDNEQFKTLGAYGTLRNLFDSTGDMEYKFRRNGRKMDHEFVSRTPRAYPNAIYQLMSLFDSAKDAM